MAGQLDSATDRYYAIEQLTKHQENIQWYAKGMVLQRAKIEKYRNSDLETARATYTGLQQSRTSLLQMLSDTRLCLMEAELYQLAETAGQIHAGLSRFDLMSNNYKPVYDLLCSFAERLPTNTTANAAVIGRLMNRVRMGYYPTDPENISLILHGIQFPEGVTTNLLDPCCGCGNALRQIAQGNNCYTYGVELDESRAENAQTRLHHVGLGSFFHSHISSEAFHLVFLNPPYLSVINENGRARHEKRFLVESIPSLVYGGLLIYVIPYYRLTPDICHILCDNFAELSVWRFTDNEFQKFKQVAILGVRKHRNTTRPDTAWLENYAVDPASIPLLSELPEGRYVLPRTPLEVKTFRGERFDRKELERQMRRSNSFAQMLARSELDDGTKSPPLPLSIGQIGLIGGSGMINGLIECDTPHIIKGRIIKAVRTETEEKFAFNGNHIGSEITETITNKMIFNVLTPNGFKSLA